MGELRLLRRLLAGRPLQNGLSVLVMACSLALAVSVWLLAGGLQRGLTQATQPFPLLVGAKGSPNQLLLNTVFLKDKPVGNLPVRLWQELQQDERVADAVPLAFGDNYHGCRLVGTTGQIFAYSSVQQTQAPWLTVASGRSFRTEHEAVLGAEAARLTGLQVGDTFHSAHGVVHHQGVAAKEHTEAYTVVGILQTMHSPYDKAVLVPLQSIWEAHHQQAAAEEITAVLVKPAGYRQAMQLAQSFARHQAAQLIFPSQTIIELFSIIGDVTRGLELFSLGACLLALLIMASSLYWFYLASGQERQVMRALGATTAQVRKIYLELGMLLTGLAATGGYLLGQLVYYLLGQLLWLRAGLYLPWHWL